MKTLKDLTPEIEAKIPLYIKKALEGVYNVDNYRNFDIEKAKKAIYWNYDFCGYKKPLVIVAENIYEQQLLFNFIVANKDYYMPILYLIYSLENKLDSELSSELRSELNSKLSSELCYKLNSKLSSELNSKLYSELCYKLNSELDSELCYKLNSKLCSELNKYNNCYLFTLNINSCAFYNYYEFIRKEFNLELSINDTFQECFRLQKESNIYSAIFSELICIVSKYPKKININKDYNLHCENDCAVEWGNEIINFNNYYWNGVNVPKQLIMNPETITKQDIISINNAEIRRCYMEKLGAKKYYEIAFGGITLIDEQIDEYDNPLKLYRSKEKDDIINDYVYFIEVVCPSTKRIYNLFPLVEKYPKSKECVLHAVASTFNKNKDNYKPIKQS